MKALCLVLILVLVGASLYWAMLNWKLKQANAIVASLGQMPACDDIESFSLQLAERLEREPTYEIALDKLCQLPGVEVHEKNEFYARCMVRLGVPSVSDFLGDGLQIELFNDNGKPSALVLNQKPDGNYVFGRRKQKSPSSRFSVP